MRLLVSQGDVCIAGLDERFSNSGLLVFQWRYRMSSHYSVDNEVLICLLLGV